MPDKSFENFLYELKQRNDIVDVISEHLEVRQKGNSYWVCCPFHNEKDPSLSISRDNQFFHCFGCKESGDVIKFIQKYKGMEFIEAVKYLAERAHMEVPVFSGNNEKATRTKQLYDRLADVMKNTALFYHKNLLDNPPKEYADYLVARDLKPFIVTRFGIGLSKNYNDLPKYLESKGFTYDEMITAGVVNKFNDKDGYYDCLGERLIFPIINNFGVVVAFGGRTLKKDALAKYKNTTQTLLFDKSKTLYGIDLVKKLKIRNVIENIIIVEGYMDVIALSKVGIQNVVASMGTSLTIDQARLLKRYTDNVYISYDGDSAGQKATMRGLDILENENLNVKVVSMPEGLDPDEVIKKYGIEGYNKCLNEAQPLVMFKINKLIESYDLTKIDEKNRCIQESLKIIKRLPSLSLSEEYLKFLRDKTKVSLETLKRDMDNVGIIKNNIVKNHSQVESVRNDKLLSFVCGCLLIGKEYALSSLDEIAHFMLTPIAHSVYNYTKECIKLKKTPLVSEFSQIFQELKDEAEKTVEDVEKSGLTEEEIQRFFIDCKVKLLSADIVNNIEMLKTSIENETDEEKKKLMIKQHQEYSVMLKKLK